MTSYLINIKYDKTSDKKWIRKDVPIFYQNPNSVFTMAAVDIIYNYKILDDELLTPSDQ